MIRVLRPARSKYNVGLDEGARAARTYQGRLYRSAREAKHARELDLQVAAGVVDHWEAEVRFPLVVDGVSLRQYHLVDFVVTYADGHVEWHEIKGTLDPKSPATRLWKLKVDILQATYLRQHPEIVYRVIR